MTVPEPPTAARRRALTVLATGWLLVGAGCTPEAPTGFSTTPEAPSATSETTTTTGPALPTTLPSPGVMPSPDQVVPSTASGFSPYHAPDEHFSVDLPSGWGVVLTPEAALATPTDDNGVEGLVMVVNAKVDQPSVEELVTYLDALPTDDGEPIEVPGAVEAMRYRGETFAPVEAVAAVDAEGNGAMVLAFDNGGSTPEQRRHILESLQFPAVGPTPT